MSNFSFSQVDALVDTSDSIIRRFVWLADSDTAITKYWLDFLNEKEDSIFKAFIQVAGLNIDSLKWAVNTDYAKINAQYRRDGLKYSSVKYYFADSNKDSKILSDFKHGPFKLKEPIVSFFYVKEPDVAKFTLQVYY